MFLDLGSTMAGMSKINEVHEQWNRDVESEIKNLDYEERKM